MQIYTLVRRFVLIFLTYMLHVNCLSHCVTDFNTVAFLIRSAVVIHRMLTVISYAPLIVVHGHMTCISRLNDTR